MDDWQGALAEVLDAGRGMAVELEENVQACGNQVPGRPETHDADCDDCRPERDAILRWARANGRLHIASRAAPRADGAVGRAVDGLRRSLSTASRQLRRGRHEAVERAIASAAGSVEELSAAVESELNALREQSESWRRVEVAWQDWAAALLVGLGLQTEDGQLGDGCAREELATWIEARRSGGEGRGGS